MKALRPLAPLTVFSALTIVLACGGPSRGGLIYRVTLDTGPLQGHPAGPFSVYFQFNSGGAIGNNHATLTDFDFGSGSPTGMPTEVSPGSTGDLSTGITLNETSAFNDFIQEFSPGASLSFTVDLTEAPNGPGTTPDVFGFGLLDRTGATIPTLDPSYADQLLTIEAAPGGTILRYGTDTLVPPAGGGSPLNIAAPTVQSVVPEPSALTMALIAAGLLGPALSRRWRGGRAA